MKPLRIAEIRKSKGLTQTQLAEKAGISRSHLAGIESGASPVNTYRIGQIARALGVDDRELLSPAPPSENADISDMERELSGLLEHMSARDRAAIMALARTLGGSNEGT